MRELRDGDRVRCVVPRDGLVLGAVYTVTAVHPASRILVYVDDCLDPYRTFRFELLEDE